MARAMLHYQHLPKLWWAEALITAAYTINRLPNSARQGTTPFELVWKEKPSLANMRVFGARGFVYVDGTKRRKWDAKSHQCIFLGYSETSKAFRVWDIEDERLVVSRTVALDERPPNQYTAVQPQNHPVSLSWTIFDDSDEKKISRPEPSE
ncbi:polyprotein [Phytophthora megakarya]|uniref:Polyprotein n=1 Tax=Phytophthora megakarya TaxID=4795 RepID=A0A225WCQ1_9STRA|nr:polyprotein [Phytophthora megakarya]